MSELQVIQSALERARRRRRLARALRGMWLGLFIGAIFTLLLVVAFHLFPLPAWVPWSAAAATLPGLLIGLLVGGWRNPHLNEVARWVDERQKLKQRLSTAIEFAGDTKAGAWRDLVVADAANHAKNLDPRRLLPLHLPRTMRWALILLALGAGLGFVPEYRSKSYVQKKADQATIKEVGRQLAELTRHTLETRPPVLEPTRTNLEAVAKLGDQLTVKTMSRSEALKDLANVAEQLKEQLQALGKDPALKRMEQAARIPGGGDAQSASNLQKQIESLQKQLGTPVGNPESLEKLQKELEKIQQNAAKNAADKNSSSSDADKQKMSEALTALSKEAQSLGVQMPQIDEAIQALAASQTDTFLKDLQQATTDLEKMRDMAKSLQQLQQQAEKLGKDLAEQLQNGQAEAAQQTLQKMIDQLNSTNLPPEQMQSLMNEVSKAVDPAGKYGKAAEHLKQAAQQMQGKNQQGAAQSLADAAKELEKLSQQMADAKELQQSLQALNEASQCVGTGKWGAKPGMPHAGKGGQASGGVGTWADENGQWNGEWTGGWDNSGLKRPDEKPRGETDRGEGELSDALLPTKVKGQFSPGGQMPSITLKGVSIKGQSKVAYEEAATAAQSDAQSALSQEKVPRAYQGAVKDYFDDLKK